MSSDDDLAVYPLAQLLAAGSENKRKMGEVRRRYAERFIDQDLLVRVGQMVLAADDVCDLHLDVVANDGEIIERVPVRAEQHEVFGFGVFAFLQAENAVGECGLARLRHFEAYGERFAGGGPGVAFGLRQFAVRVVAHILFAALGTGTFFDRSLLRFHRPGLPWA